MPSKNDVAWETLFRNRRILDQIDAKGIKEIQVRTAEWLAAHRGPVVLSNQATSRIVRLCQKLGFEVRYLNSPRRISCNGDRSTAREVLAARGF
jgi:hypothetical protein